LTSQNENFKLENYNFCQFNNWITIDNSKTKFWAVVFRYCKPGASFPGLLCVLRTPYINSSPICVYKRTI